MVNINKYTISFFHLISFSSSVFFPFRMFMFIDLNIWSSPVFQGVCFSRTCQKKRFKPVSQPTRLQKTSWNFFQGFIKHYSKIKWLFSFEFAFSGKVDFCNGVFWMVPELFFPLGHWVMDGWENPFALK